VARNYRKNVATSDALTGLLNRTGFMTALKAASFESDNLSLFFIDLNKFKPVNDTYGHKAGDYVLQVIADRLRDLFPHKSLITRLGGDEYCILLLDTDKFQAESKIKLISKELEKEINCEGALISVSGSIGLANYPADTNNAEELISLADKQMYIKKEGR
ncbi:MAG: putative signaling protein, partial [Proteobacteria bacterium]